MAAAKKKVEKEAALSALNATLHGNTTSGGGGSSKKANTSAGLAHIQAQLQAKAKAKAEAKAKAKAKAEAQARQDTTFASGDSTVPPVDLVGYTTDPSFRATQPPNSNEPKVTLETQPPARPLKPVASGSTIIHHVKPPSTLLFGGGKGGAVNSSSADAKSSGNSNNKTAARRG